MKYFTYYFFINGFLSFLENDVNNDGNEQTSLNEFKDQNGQLEESTLVVGTFIFLILLSLFFPRRVYILFDNINFEYRQSCPTRLNR